MNLLRKPIRRRNRINSKFYEPKVYKGTLLIPDISGFTKFVHTTDMILGKTIILRLLSSIIRSNNLGLQVSEIEGDAILFYSYEKKFTVKEILDQYEIMLESFNHELALISEELGEEIDLTLKLIAHYGKLADYKIGKFQKLYGETVIEAHHLLKNKIESHTYVLITDELLEDNVPAMTENGKNSFNKQICDKYSGLKNLCFTFFDYQALELQKLSA
ncbi:DUF2652 domain-containing protein [Antarcticibacterium sp. 1MA-6-2]|uniref:DUF2652 domain-containing protein n=1 Tax=Antarcticibacterium sp. 1MA-6-2 TaxID=2908210 RepID=UPI001F400812|nr:DUF2652 domain-containing protein [Antarcticibacterium sp. 1MA-6-2]UJH91951.1 DUF2652 domain-containing protein [Antarcticibacterium sp. 1MA-6-2]